MVERQEAVRTAARVERGRDRRAVGRLGPGLWPSPVQPSRTRRHGPVVGRNAADRRYVQRGSEGQVRRCLRRSCRSDQGEQGGGLVRPQSDARAGESRFRAAVRRRIASHQRAADRLRGIRRWSRAQPSIGSPGVVAGQLRGTRILGLPKRYALRLFPGSASPRRGPRRSRHDLRHEPPSSVGRVAGASRHQSLAFTSQYGSVGLESFVEVDV